MTKGRPTLDLVARTAGVSKATASKVVNGRREVAQSTREHVQAVIDSLGYAPSTGRPAQDVPSVTVLFDAFVNLYSTQILNGVVSAGNALGIDVVVTHLPADSDRHQVLTPEWFRSLVAQNRLGVIVVTTALSSVQVRACADAGLGLVAIDPVAIDPAGSDWLLSVSATNWTGGKDATEHLAGLGHRRIGFAGGPPASRPAQQRLHGHLAALEDRGLEVDRSLLRQQGFSYEDGRDMTNDLLDSDAPPTAIVAGCDASALGVMEAARSRGLSLPDELSIIGFDDTSMAEWTSPKLTTIRQPMQEMGQMALRTLLRVAGGGRPETHHVELATTLIVRESTTAWGGDGLPHVPGSGARATLPGSVPTDH